MVTTLTSMIRDEEGATMVEYGLLVAFIALVALVGVKALGTGLNGLFTGIAGSL
ncbi:MAG TPA: Flp family type IVb pilin [Candidatus Cybelea sp.]|jgi:pilus assembly protein Flp/PilA|nr:Flp family type IVb pilin [Candidatus Cybelea sp.]